MLCALHVRICTRTILVSTCVLALHTYVHGDVCSSKLTIILLPRDRFRSVIEEIEEMDEAVQYLTYQGICGPLCCGVLGGVLDSSPSRRYHVALQ